MGSSAAPPRPARDVVVRVHYPAAPGGLALRCDADWDRDLVPVRVDLARGRYDFRVPVEGSHRFFKPVLAGGDAPRWAQGENRVALQGARRALDVWPWFDPDESCHVCDLHRPPTTASGAEHDVRVFLPPGYGENTLQCYPVVYLQDGHNLFFPEESFAGETWRIQETLRVLQQMALTRQVVAVGVIPRDRTAQYTAPGYEAYGRYVVEDLKPWVDANYRTLTGPEHTLAMGSSLGGVVSFHLAWTYPRVFGGSACLSSTFGWRDDLLERVYREERRPIRVYLDSGWPHDNYEATRAMRSALARRGWSEGRDLHYLAFPRATHDERAWALRAHVPFQLFFGEPA